MSSSYKRYVPGTPIGEERSPRSPVTPEEAKRDKLDAIRHSIQTPPPVPPLLGTTAPSTSSNVTLEAIGNLLRQEINPMKSSMSALEHRMGQLTLQVNQRMDKLESRVDSSEVRIHKLEQLVENGTSDSALAQQVEKRQK